MMTVAEVQFVWLLALDRAVAVAAHLAVAQRPLAIEG